MSIYISGIGIVSALGIGVEENAKKLLSGSTGVTELHYIESIHKNVLPVGEVKASDTELLQLAKLTSTKNITRTSALGIIAAKEAIKTAQLSPDEIKKIAIVSSSTAGGMRESEQKFNAFLQGKNNEDFLSTHDGNDSTEKIAEELGIRNFHTTINTACSSSANAIILGARMIKSGLYDMVLVGGSDALAKFTINGFNSLLLLDKEACKPFDAKRKGINLGEGAGYLVLESESSIKKRKHTPIAELIGYANRNDTFHPSATSPEGRGLQLSMTDALKMAGLQHSEIDYINAHGTATLNNDLTEGIAMKTVFNNNVPSFSSTKSYTGHCLGAAGSMEAIFSIFAIQHNTVFKNLNFKTPISEHALTPQLITTSQKNITHVLSNSAGMGGFCSSLIFQKTST
ncbi:3-oxoacyl-[acyl-carrier-protein] synthase 2 [Kordia antarctica]|uniref:3-oxoacyl-[acyl-carrier-protein] synthase 2 n=1 Tax=Kordia antarctica TaxID=1218801 RepID=A0A7L4ZJU4_9FLAO|nr:beta-ketoacyl-[acyl-carrier-protein] synthase family protein [Kordia antarctica]QHI36895.1 3-oxoacyl-[acyl-carrier-protein] synthase 2 [Kordia antarctica]